MSKWIKMKNGILTAAVLLGVTVCAWADTGEKEKARISESANVITDIFNAPDKGVPLGVLDRTKCVIVIP